MVSRLIRRIARSTHPFPYQGRISSKPTTIDPPPRFSIINPETPPSTGYYRNCSLPESWRVSLCSQMDLRVASIKTLTDQSIKKVEEQSINPLRSMVRKLKDLTDELDARKKLESANLKARVEALEVNQKTWMGEVVGFLKYLSISTFMFTIFQSFLGFLVWIGSVILLFLGFTLWYKKTKKQFLDWVEESDSWIASILATIISWIRDAKKKLDELENLANEESESGGDGVDADGV